MLKLRKFQAGTWMPTVSRTEGQHLVSLKTFIKSKASRWRRLWCSVSKFDLPNNNNNNNNAMCISDCRRGLDWWTDLMITYRL
jgi:hypothetical protein